MKKDIKLKGQLKLYMQWPGIMILFLILMNIWIFRMDRKAGLLMSAFAVSYTHLDVYKRQGEDIIAHAGIGDRAVIVPSGRTVFDS